MSDADQCALVTTEEAPSLDKVVDVLIWVLSKHEQPSAWDLVSVIERELGWKSRWSVKEAVGELKARSNSTRAWRGYLESLTKSGDLDAVLKGVDAPRKEIASSVDSLLRHSKVYQFSEQFREMVRFMARFRDYAPYNNMLVRLQNPSCSFYATERDWQDRFGRTLKEDARPIIQFQHRHLEESFPIFGIRTPSIRVAHKSPRSTSRLSSPTRLRTFMGLAKH